MPRLDPALLDPATSLGWADVAELVLCPFLPDLPRAPLRAAIESAAARFSHPEVAPVASVGDRFFLELFHGPTLAFKDLALSLFGSLLSLSRAATDTKEELIVLTATSGDTGKAALDGLAGVPGVRVIVYYPESGVSGVQRLQMLTHAATGAAVVGVRGNFDDAQRGVKRLFGDPGLRDWMGGKGFLPTSANSINIGRLLPQIAYYVSAWRSLAAGGALGARGRELDVVVPTGNFGDILAARYAKAMGLPLGRLVSASNRNRVLADFFASGTYDRERPFHRTTSPSMDILVSSNLERLLFEASGRDAGRTAFLMDELARKGSYSLSSGERAALADFSAGWAEDGEAATEIARSFTEDGYLIDPHTAVAACVERRLRASGELSGPALILSTASPFKFPAATAAALGLPAEGDELELAERLAEHAGMALPAPVAALRGAPLRHEAVVDPDGMEAALRRFLEGGRP
jgi:threonine synthase